MRKTHTTTVIHADGSTVQIPPLLACPFCGYVPYAGPASAMSYEVRCLGCGARTREFTLPDVSARPMAKLEQSLIDEAAEAWNQRSQPCKMKI